MPETVSGGLLDGRLEGHTEHSRLAVLKLKVLIRELLAVNGLAASTVTIGEITALNHELLYDSVESAALVSEALLSRSQSARLVNRCASIRLEDTIPEVLRRLETVSSVGHNSWDEYVPWEPSCHKGL
jgi:hypothetical protein